MKKKLVIILSVIYLLIVSLFFLDIYFDFEMKNELLKKSIYYGFLFISPTILISNLFLIKKMNLKILSLILSVLPIIIIIKIGFLKILFLSESWKTQMILYENSEDNSVRVEYQLKDLGALGYRKRTVEVNYYSHYFMKVKPYNKENTKNWKRVDKYINELELKN
ncbi:hypothetical protein [Aureivirga sp. CE67]|uniref:hypothetical protein n=1 Tax=Aureivirga sp. CE67 TaxID=1788983 RepID=UPI0018C946AB|nr:hypothetical protein [Aureivirga sp. CE67]